MQTPASHRLGRLIASYHRHPSGQVALAMFPASTENLLAPKRQSLRGEPEIDLLPGSPALPAQGIDSLVHLHIAGDPYPGGFAQGRTLRGSSSNARFTVKGQTVRAAGDRTEIVTTLISVEGLQLDHHVLSDPASPDAVTIHTRLTNNSPQPIRIEMLTSFCLSAITPFHPADAPGRLRVHRFRSAWSAEGRQETQSLESLHLERSWSGAALLSERFGQVGTMPVRGWFPFIAIEDTEARVLWGAQLAWAGSWQMEISRQHDDVSISGGLADREFGHWWKTLAPGESLLTPAATVACVHGTLDDLCDALTAAQRTPLATLPAVEQEMPIVFNEWATTWGNPRHEQVVRIAERLKDSGVTYLVIDAGWYKPDVNGYWDGTHGDWVANRELFPHGLKATADAIRACGLVPGLWFELETVGSNAQAFHRTDLLLHRDGIPLTVRGRRFWNMNHPAVIEHLSPRVIDTLETCGFGYLKIDYNETLGIGCDEDGAGSQGEGLRRQVEGVYHFLELLRQRLPHLVIENCASGGHRHEPSMLARTAMSSFSDAHELREIPILAANLHRLMLPRQTQVWAVLHAADSEQRLLYSLAATFLGRMCLSGEIDRLSPDQWALVRRAIGMYQRAAPILKHGTFRRFGTRGESWRHPSGWQAVVAAQPDHALIVLHAFDNPPPLCSVPLPPGRWQIADQLASSRSSPISLVSDTLLWHPSAFTGAVLRLTLE